jgi:hypothetical protein
MNRFPGRDLYVFPAHSISYYVAVREAEQESQPEIPLNYEKYSKTPSRYGVHVACY